MTRGFWRDPERYLETYWSRWPDVWVHGDWAYMDEDGYWFLQGRSDDTIKIAGKRLGPAEVESAAGRHPAVAEAAAIGVPTRSRARRWLLRRARARRRRRRTRCRPSVAAGRRGAGQGVQARKRPVRARCPKTRSAKIMRRAIRADGLGQDPGDLSSLENPQVLDGFEAEKPQANAPLGTPLVGSPACTCSAPSSRACSSPP